jgi:hypothetical protein
VLYISQYNLYKIQVYARSKHDKYYTFCTPECAKAIDTYLDYRKSFGEDISKRSSPLIREQFNIDDKIRIHSPRPLSKRMIVHLVEQALKRSGVKTSGEVMRSHGFRKAWVTQSIKAKMDYNAREYLVGHRLSRDDPSYDRTSEEDRLCEYTKVMDLLTISPENRLRIEVQEKDQIINHKLKERDDAFTTLSDQVMKLMAEVQELKKCNSS